ncbi:MAG TPA: hypothetical protein PLI95_02065, partial [Polyangiaceae bacterium]|nr:hypothetical protein [Polyangiaceae bacterium]
GAAGSSGAGGSSGTFYCAGSDGSCLFDANGFCYERAVAGFKDTCTGDNIWSDLPCTQRSDVKVAGGCETGSGTTCQVVWYTEVSSYKTGCGVQSGTWHEP